MISSKMQTAGKPSYYDPEGETIYLSSPPAASEAGAKKGRRRGPEMNDVLGYIGSATLLVAHASMRKSIYGAFEASTGPHAIDAVSTPPGTGISSSRTRFCASTPSSSTA